MAVSAPQANAYEFQSSGIVDMLEKLKDKFEDERTDLEKEESNARHAYEMLMQDLTAQIATPTRPTSTTSLRSARRSPRTSSRASSSARTSSRRSTRRSRSCRPARFPATPTS